MVHSRNLSILFIVFIFSSSFSFASSMGARGESAPRLWKSTLNIIANGIEIDMDSWVEENKAYINQDRQRAIQAAFKHPGSPVISRGRIIFFYHYSDDPEIKAFIVEINCTFLSSMRQQASDCALDEKAISSYYFYRGDESSFKGKEFNAQQCTSIMRLIDVEAESIKDGSHSEATFLLFLEKRLPEIFEKLLEREEGKNLVFVGAITQLLILKDSCIGCGTMLDFFARNLQHILRRNSASFRQIHINEIFEALVLTAGTTDFMGSRDGIDVNEEPTILNFDIGLARTLFSMGIPKEPGGRIEEIFPSYIYVVNP